VVSSVRSIPLALLTLYVGCSDAQYDGAGPDASRMSEPADGKIEDAGQDAKPSLDATMVSRETGPVETPDAAPTEPAWHSQLAKNYAIAARFYAKDRGLADQALYSHEIWSLAKITIEGDRVSMETTRCLDEGNVIAIAVGLKDDFWWPNAQAIPPQRYDLVMRPDGLRTEAPATPIGFRREQPGGCDTANTVKVDGRPWLKNGSCECRKDELPLLATDCRVVDDDGDDRPGVTVNHKGVLNEPENTRTLDNSQITKGQLSADGSIRAFYLQSYESLSLMCGAEACTRAEIASCPLELNPVDFEPLPDGEWDCKKMLAEQAAGRLWTYPPLVFVSGC
jgi:hypothetical protein